MQRLKNLIKNGSLCFVVILCFLAGSSSLEVNQNFAINLREDSPVVDWNKNESACMINVRLIYDFSIPISDPLKSLYDFHFNLLSCDNKDESSCKDISQDWPKCQNLCNLQNKFS